MANVNENTRGLAPILLMLSFATTATLGACDMTKITVNTTAKVLSRAQPSVKQESDYELAAAAIPGSLKTVEGFHVVNPGNEKLVMILAEGYCQYGIGFVEDQFELADIAKDFDRKEELAQRATKMYLRCMNYALKDLGGNWNEVLFGPIEPVQALADKHIKSGSNRDALMWVAIALASTINMNKDDPALIAMLPTAKLLLDTVVAIDEKHGQKDSYKKAMPHVGLGKYYASRSPALGGDPDKGRDHLQKAFELTEGKFLLPKVYIAKDYAVITQKQELFRTTLVEVLQTPPNIWPEQRLANEIAHRRARRYLSQEKEWF
jgi:hypothetical protein